MSAIAIITATIGLGQSLSAGVGFGVNTLVGVQMPAAWDAADLTFQVSTDGGTTWSEMVDVAGNAIDYKAAASRYVPIDPILWRGVNNVKVRSGTSGVAVNQTADRLIGLVTRPIAAG